LCVGGVWVYAEECRVQVGSEKGGGKAILSEIGEGEEVKSPADKRRRARGQRGVKSGLVVEARVQEERKRRARGKKTSGEGVSKC